MTILILTLWNITSTPLLYTEVRRKSTTRYRQILNFFQDIVFKVVIFYSTNIGVGRFFILYHY